jgi:hypothetical protein
MNLAANLAKKLNVFTLLTILLGASGAIGGLTHQNPVAAAIFSAGTIVILPLQGYLSTLVIVIPAPAYAVALKVYAVLIGLTGATAVIVQWFSTYGPAEKEAIVLVLSALAIAATLATQLFHAVSSQQQGKRRVAHG